MAIVVGIDEAGYGPLLGPLVVSAAVFQMPDQLVGKNLWDMLAGSVTAKASRRLSRTPVPAAPMLVRAAVLQSAFCTSQSSRSVFASSVSMVRDRAVRHS